MECLCTEEPAEISRRGIAKSIISISPREADFHSIDFPSRGRDVQDLEPHIVHEKHYSVYKPPKLFGIR